MSSWHHFSTHSVHTTHLNKPARGIGSDCGLSGDGESHSQRTDTFHSFPLAQLASEYHVAVVLVSHLAKRFSRRALHRAFGSTAFVAAARSAWCIAEDLDDAKRRLMLPLKNNLVAESDGLAFRLVPKRENGVGEVQWEVGRETRSLKEVLEANYFRCVPDRSPEFAERFPTRWLREQLLHGPMSYVELSSYAAQFGLTPHQLRRAARQLDVVKLKSGFREGWVWQLPSKSMSHMDSISV
jgi:hypothetical protein